MVLMTQQRVLRRSRQRTRLQQDGKVAGRSEPHDRREHVRERRVGGRDEPRGVGERAEADSARLAARPQHLRARRIVTVT